MKYEITATRKRPQTFEDLVDQEFVVTTIRSAIKQGRIAHAYLFSGPRGVGKTSAARILAKSLNCETGPTEKPCGTCNSCSEITLGNSLNVIEIDGASNTSVNDVREIKDEVLFAPNNAKYKIYIIDEVHMLSNNAFNALLKTIEEPPPYIIFIFATTEIHKVPATIRSRCQQFNFRQISIDGIKSRLLQVIAENGIKAEDEAVFWIAKESTGSLRDAYTLLDQVIAFSDGDITLLKIKEKLGIVGQDDLNEIFKAIVDKNISLVLQKTHTILAKGIAIEQFVIDFAEYMRNILLLKHGIKKDSILGHSISDFPLPLIEKISAFQVEFAVEILLNLFRNLRYSLNQKYELELVMSKLSYLTSMISQKDILSEIYSIKKELFSLSDEQSDTISEECPNDDINTLVNRPDDNKNDINILEELIRHLHTHQKLALASALEKVELWKLEGNELCLEFDTKNKFQGEIVKKDRKEVIEHVSTLISKPIKLNVIIKEIMKDETTGTNDRDDRIEVLKTIFNGKEIKGENHG
jgi:DNA polymerase-3 subunit gamma/tau